MPVLYTRKALRRMAPGEELVVHSTDPLAAIDIPHCVKEDGHSLVLQTRTEAVSTFRIVKTARSVDDIREP